MSRDELVYLGALVSDVIRLYGKVQGDQDAVALAKLRRAALAIEQDLRLLDRCSEDRQGVHRG